MKAKKMNLIGQAVEFDLLREQAILHEQLALKKLRWTQWKMLWGLFEPVELVQQVGPDQPPLRRHEWERQDVRPII